MLRHYIGRGVAARDDTVGTDPSPEANAVRTSCPCPPARGHPEPAPFPCFFPHTHDVGVPVTCTA
eukprot:scaffold30948_cov112-Isochrysis_galbana.AAC.1